MADFADLASDLEERERAWALERHRRRTPYRNTLPRGFDAGQPGDEAMAAALATEAEEE